MNANEQESARYPLTDGMVNRIREASVRRILPDQRDFYTIRRDGGKTIYTVHAHVEDTIHTWEARGIGANDEKDTESSVVCAMIKAYAQMPMDYSSASAATAIEAGMHDPTDASVAAAKSVTAKPAGNLERVVRETTTTEILPVLVSHIMPDPGLGYGWGV